jgi:DNA-directed RNA polymerase alpha subunit
MRRTFKQSILGRRISKADALKDLGDPDTWRNEAEDLAKEFQAKPYGPSRVVELQTYGLPVRIVKALERVRIRPAQTRRMTDSTLRKVAGIGKASLRQLRRKVGRLSAKKKKTKGGKINRISTRNLSKSKRQR